MNVIIFGVGDLAKQLYFYLDQTEDYNVELFCVNKEYLFENEFLGKKVIAFEELSASLNPTEYKFIIGVGYKNLRMRKTIFNMIKSKGFNLVNYIHPTATILGEIKGEGNIILPNVVIEPFSEVYDNNIIWSNCILCHDSVIGSHNFIAATSVIGGFSKVIDNNFLGFNSIVKDNVVIEKEVLIGAKSLIVKSPDNHSLYYGIPAKKIKEHHELGIEIQ